MADAGTWQETVRVVAAALQGLAIVFGAVWGYIKFVQGRTFNKRAELDVARRSADGRGRGGEPGGAILRNEPAGSCVVFQVTSASMPRRERRESLGRSRGRATR